MHIAWQKQTMLAQIYLGEPLVRVEIKNVPRRKNEIVRAHSELVLANLYELGICVN